YVGKFPPVLQGAEPEIPIFNSSHQRRAIVAAILFPNRTPVDSTGVDIIRAQQLVRYKRADNPGAPALAEVLRITVNDANLWISVQDSNSTLDIAGAQTIVCI